MNMKIKNIKGPECIFVAYLQVCVLKYFSITRLHVFGL